MGNALESDCAACARHRYCFLAGAVCTAGLLFVCAPFEIPDKFHLPFGTSRPWGIVLLFLAAVFLLICGLRKSPMRIGNVNLQPPPLIALRK